MQAGSNNYTRYAKQTQENFVEYFNSPEGSVPQELTITKLSTEKK